MPSNKKRIKVAIIIDYYCRLVELKDKYIELLNTHLSLFIPIEKFALFNPHVITNFQT
mgnify:CR=1 FL=1